MEDKNEIFNNVETYSVPQLAEYIKRGLFTKDELYSHTVGDLSYRKKKELEQVLDGASQSEAQSWQVASRTGTAQAYQNYLAAFPSGPHAQEAQQSLDEMQQAETREQNEREAWENIDRENPDSLKRFLDDYPQSDHRDEVEVMLKQLRGLRYKKKGLERLKQEIIDIKDEASVVDIDGEIAKTVILALKSKSVSSDELLSLISEDHNYFRASTVKAFIDSNCIEPEELEGRGIDGKFLEYLLEGKHGARGFDAPPREVTIEKLCTEVYFWGIPSSGKSCALGAILSTANNGHIVRTMTKDNCCQGYDYMNRLALLFKANGQVSSLPEGTPTTSSYAMSFDLTDNDGRIHPLTCVDLAGELMLCMYRKDAGLQLTSQQETMLSAVTQLIIGNERENRKIHIFVLEYGGEQRTYDGISQKEYLDGARNYIASTGIFDRATDAIYLMITKADKTHAVGEEMTEKLKEYIDEHYPSFYNGLTDLCDQKEINGGMVPRIPFSLGKVCFQDYCLFNDEAARMVIYTLLGRCAGKKPATGMWGRFRNFFSN